MKPIIPAIQILGLAALLTGEANVQGSQYALNLAAFFVWAVVLLYTVILFIPADQIFPKRPVKNQWLKKASLGLMWTTIITLAAIGWTISATALFLVVWLMACKKLAWTNEQKKREARSGR